MLEIILENKKIFKIIFIIVAVIAVIFIWVPKKDSELSKFEMLSKEEAEEITIKQYGNELQLALYSNNIEFLQNNVSLRYLIYNGILSGNYENWLIQNNLVLKKTNFNQTTKYEYGNKNIYSINASIDGRPTTLNIIEEYPEKWTYTFGTFINYVNYEHSKEQNRCGVVINSIYQDVNYIEFDCSAYVSNEVAYEIDVSKVDSIKLKLNDGTSFVMDNNTTNNTSDSKIIDDKRYVDMKCIFNTPIDVQGKIESIVFSIFNINNKEKELEVDLTLL